MSELNLKIDPEFENLLPPLTEEEFNNLEELILQDGEVRDPIITWNGTIVDGHNRWKIICKHPDIPWTSKEKKFTDKWEVIAWMILTQKGRRNLNSAQQSVLRTKYYEAKKLTHGGIRGNQHVSLPSYHSGNLANEKTMQSVAKDFGVGVGTIERDIQFVRGLDAVREEDPELADNILNGTEKVSKVDVTFIGKAKPEERKELIKTVKSGERLKKREELKEIANIANDLFGDSTPYSYSIDELIRDIRNNCLPFVRLLSSMVSQNKELCMANKEKVIETIHENTIMKIKEIEKEIGYYE